MNKLKLKSLNSFFAYSYQGFKEVMVYGALFSIGVFLLQAAIVIISSQKEYSTDSYGITAVMMLIMLIAFMCGIFLSNSDKNIKNLFRFPINRPTYALGNFLYALITPLAIITATSFFFVIEIFIFKILSLISVNFSYINTITIVSYLEGLLPSYAILVFLMSFIYMISMYFHRYKIPFTLMLTLLAFAIIILPNLQSELLRAFLFIFQIKNVFPHAIYMLGLSVIAHLIAYIPLKFMEVK